MGKKVKSYQLVVRLTKTLDAKIKKAAEKEGLQKAGWARRLFIKTLESDSTT